MITLYRYVDEDHGDTVAIHCERFAVIQQTPKGYWFVPLWVLAFPWESQKKHRRWVSMTARRRFCYPTRQEAWNSYRLRKHHQQGHLERAQDRLDAALALIAQQGDSPPAPTQPPLVHAVKSRGVLFDF